MSVRTTTRMTTAQALVRFLAAQYTLDTDGARGGDRRPFFAGMLGIFGHGNLAGIGQALQETGALRYVPARNEQSMVHIAAGYARATRRMQTWACTSSIGPGATNMVTAAAGATINRLPVLLLPGDTFATRRADPVLQQLEQPHSRAITVNDALAPVSRLFDRVHRPEQLWSALVDAMRVLTDPVDTGAVTIALPQDVQAEAWDFPDEMFAERIWRLDRPMPVPGAIDELVQRVHAARRPLIVAGGGVAYSRAQPWLEALARETGIPVACTQAGTGALGWDHPQALGAIGATGTLAANRYAAEADLVIGVGTRWSDFTTASRTAFPEDAQLVAVNVARIDAVKHGATAIVADAARALDELRDALDGWQVPEHARELVEQLTHEWRTERDRVCADRTSVPAVQAGVIAAVNDAVGDRGTVVCAAGSMPGDLHKLWRAPEMASYHVEYGFSCMGYEIPGAIGVQLAEPDRHVVAMVGDGSWLMGHGELVTAIQEGVRLTVVLVDNQGYGSIGALSRSLGSGGFGTSHEFKVDYVASAAALGAHSVRAETADDVAREVTAAGERAGVTVIVVATDPAQGVPGYDSWWDVPVAQATDMDDVRAAREEAAAHLARARREP